MSIETHKLILNSENPNTAASKGVSIIECSSSITINNTVYLYGFSKSTIKAPSNKSITSNIWSIASNEIATNIPLTSFTVSTAVVSSSLYNRTAPVDTQDTSDLQPYLPYSFGVASNSLDELIVFTSTLHDQIAKNPWRDNSSNNYQGFNTSAIDDENKTTTINTTTSSAVYFSVYKFGLISKNGWSKLVSTSIDAPFYRQEHSIALSLPDRAHVYMFGGINSTQSQNDFWRYSLANAQWKKIMLPANVKQRCGHTASMLSNGNMIIIGGYHCSGNSFRRTLEEDSSKQSNLKLFDMADIVVFNSLQSTWETQSEIKGTVPTPRIFHSAILVSGLNKNNNIFVCGGQNGIKAPYQTYIGSQRDRMEEMTAILDTDTWTWRIPKPSVYQPFPQSFASISVINDTKVVYGFGSNYQTVYDNFNVFDMSKELWEPPASNVGVLGEGIFINSIFSKNGKATNALFWIVLCCFLSALVLSCAIAIWVFGWRRFHIKIFNLYKTLKIEIWKPRVGEPGWAESSRLLLKTLFLMLFVYLTFVLTSQVLNSPVIDQLSYETNEQMLVDVPDVKFCFESWEQDTNPIIRCITDFGAQCSNFFYQLPKQSNQDGSSTVCSLFRAPFTFNLGQTSKRSLGSSGSFLKFDYYYSENNRIIDQNETSLFDKKQQVKIEIYNKLHDPNLELYKSVLGNSITNASSSIFQWNSIEEENMYRSESDLVGKASSLNTYRLSTRLMSTVSFELIKRISLKASVWNYIGISPTVYTRYEINTMTTSESFPLEYNPLSNALQPFGSLHIFPANYQTKVLREQKAFAFINAVGIFGGLFGLLFSLQTCLFGYRPRSPWGYMHRWSFGHFRSSLINGLHSNFFPSTIKFFINNTQHAPIVQQQQPSTVTPPTMQHQKDVYSMSLSSSVSSSIHGISRPSANQRTDYSEKTNQSIASSPSTINPKNGLYPLIIPNEITKANNSHNTNYLLSPSPIINFSEIECKQGNALRMTLIEERIHTLERLFQAYYIDDEIFRSLDCALQADRRDADTTVATSNNTFSSSFSANSNIDQNSSNVAVEKRRVMKKGKN